MLFNTLFYAIVFAGVWYLAGPEIALLVINTIMLAAILLRDSEKTP
jgi:hypothetical protein